MILARVTGVVVAPQKDPELERNRLLIIHPIGPDGALTGSSFLALDRVDAGEGDTVLVNREGSGARLMFGTDKIPLQAVVVAVVDRWHVEGAPPGKPEPVPGRVEGPLREPPHASHA